VEEMPGIALFKDISENRKYFSFHSFFSQENGRNHTFLFHCCDHTSERNTAFEMIF